MKIILTGDRPTGPLHLGHYVGSLQNRVALQHQAKQYIMIADLQALTDNVDNPQKVRDNVCQVLLDYLAVGIDSQLSTIFIQSLIPEIAELTIIYLNLVTVNRLKRNPTVKTEMAQKEIESHVTAGFLMYPVHQAADITIVKADCVPVGADQLPMIEQANELIQSFHYTYKTTIFPHIKAEIPKTGSRLPGIDGKQKMSKSLGNAIYLSDTADVVAQKVMKMYTDPNHLRVQDPGRVEDNTVFAYLDIFDPEQDQVAELKAHYQKGGLGDVLVKKRLIEVLNTVLEPIRIKRMEYAQDMQQILNIALQGTEKVKAVAQQTMSEVKNAINLLY